MKPNRWGRNREWFISRDPARAAIASARTLRAAAKWAAGNDRCQRDRGLRPWLTVLTVRLLDHAAFPGRMVCHSTERSTESLVYAKVTKISIARYDSWVNTTSKSRYVPVTCER